MPVEEVSPGKRSKVSIFEDGASRCGWTLEGRGFCFSSETRSPFVKYHHFVQALEPGQAPFEARKILRKKGATVRNLSTFAIVIVVVLTLLVGVAPVLLGAADHLDAPLVATDGRLDINDVYVSQSPSNPANTVLIMTVNPVAGILSPTTFHPGASYDIKIDTDGDAKEDSTYKVTFSAPDGSGVQEVTLRRVPARGEGAVLARGQTGLDIAVEGGGMLRADLFDDPFFFDLVAFRNGLAFCPGGVGTNFFAGLNVSAIVLEVPSATLGPSNIGVWARTYLNEQQIDRMGRPAINTVFIPSGMKDAFNSGQPKHDQRDFRDEVVATLLALGNPEGVANALADFLLPDILTIDTSAAAVFPNGRRPPDDVIDIELGLISGGAITTDCVANDSAFTSTFPYLAPAN